MQRGKKINRWLDVWVGTPVLNLFATFRRRRSLAARTPRRLGVMCSPALGDTLLFSGALQDLRAALPDTRITHICMRQNLAAAEIIPGADERLLIDLTRPLESVQLLRRQHFDVLLDFTSWQRLTAFVTLFSGAGYTVGFNTPGQRRSRGYDRTVQHRADRHETANFRALLLGSGLGLAPDLPHRPDILLPSVPELPFRGEADTVALHLWASGQRAHLREWPEERWIDLARRLARSETLFVITGAPTDSSRMESFVRRLQQQGLRAQAFVSPDGFRTLVQVLLHCRLVVTVNTGVMHLAAIAGATTVAINGPNRNDRWGPVGPRALGVEASGAGCGFLHLGFEFDGRAEDCMERTSVESVFQACRSLLASAGTAASIRPPASKPSLIEAR